mmetsp:Transcript_11813/g.19396  ORF Transcript_11813/g.19396 Transcript_11813/m.19396 type:complete len:189 (+) Transcript_11813:143-709(+)|eukprot:CAMPEP_0169089242 /NCGR_PEP_ID=MMETSP1015-20121227/15176_1 /TAXON_ID=342587 /ORGANISM="Karlodinium micrum, Strain CCMP2283" /LENGTH=188 /DNA_ID=CAMNT_0009149557 /DNA_START=58 /DNA_END=624 /DNA_ORIENTATION=-
MSSTTGELPSTPKRWSYELDDTVLFDQAGEGRTASSPPKNLPPLDLSAATPSPKKKSPSKANANVSPATTTSSSKPDKDTSVGEIGQSDSQTSKPCKETSAREIEETSTGRLQSVRRGVEGDERLESARLLSKTWFSVWFSWFCTPECHCHAVEVEKIDNTLACEERIADSEIPTKVESLSVLSETPV